MIIGGGVIGLSIARELRKRKAGKITVLDRGKPGHEASWAAAGILAPQAEADRIDDFFRLCSASRDLYPKFSAELLDETGIDIELDKSGTLYLAFSDNDVTDLRKRFEWQRSAGLEVSKRAAKECRELEPLISKDVLEGLLFPNDWQVDNRRLIVALTEFARRNDIEVVEQTKVEKIVLEDQRITRVQTSGGVNFSADAAVLATGAWTSLIKIGEIPLALEVKPIRGQMICFKLPDRQLTRVIYSPRGYLVPRSDGRVLAGATVEDVGFNTHTTDAGIASLRKVASEVSPLFDLMEPVDQWAGLRPHAPGGQPTIGRMPDVENLFVATAHYRNGILLAPLTANWIADLIAEDRLSEFLPSFTPQTVRSGGKAM